MSEYGTTQHTIDAATCSGCGTCADLCPAHVFEVVEQGGKKLARRVPAFGDGCMRCGHCMAACPTASVTVEGIAPEDLYPLPPERPDADAFQRFLERRRSVRAFQDVPVPRPLLERIVAMVALAPMGYTPHKLDVTVVERRETMARALPGMVALYQKLLGAWRNRLLRWLISRELAPDLLHALATHVMPTLAPRLEGTRAGRWDTITRGAPAMLLFHSRPDAGDSSEDARVAAAYALLAAHALGLGATMIGLVPPAVEKSPEVRRILGIPEGHRVHTAVIVGIPRYRFLRGIRRSLPAVHWA
jgi:nitroreductase/ferredoxin